MKKNTRENIALHLGNCSTRMWTLEHKIQELTDSRSALCSTYIDSDSKSLKECYEEMTKLKADKLSLLKLNDDVKSQNKLNSFLVRLNDLNMKKINDLRDHKILSMKNNIDLLLREIEIHDTSRAFFELYFCKDYQAKIESYFSNSFETINYNHNLMITRILIFNVGKLITNNSLPKLVEIFNMNVSIILRNDYKFLVSGYENVELTDRKSLTSWCHKIFNGATPLLNNDITRLESRIAKLEWNLRNYNKDLESIEREIHRWNAELSALRYEYEKFMTQ